MDKREQLIAELEAKRPEIEQMMRAHGADEPDWEPLEKALPLKWCGGFMFMGYYDGIREYKHGLTRRTLCLDSEGRSYTYDSKLDAYREIDLEIAVDHVYEDIEEMGYTRETVITDEVMAERRKRLEEAGWKVVTVGPEQ